MKYTIKRTQTKNVEYVQHSKKLANWALLQFVLVALVVVGALLQADWSDFEASVLSNVVTWSATLASIGVTGYMGNSSIEKYANRKFAIAETIETTGGEG